MGLRVLITNLYVAHGSGSEAVIELLADGLRRAGHDPMLYAPTLGEQAIRMRRRGHVVVDRIAQLPHRPDILHLQHATPAAMALAAFPAVPAIFSCHSAFFEVEAPRPHPQIRRWIAVDDLCRDRCLSRGVPAERLSVILNAVDTERFAQRAPLPPRPRRALMLTKTTEQQNLVRAVCAEMGIALDELGPGTGRVTDRLEDELPAYDLVFATARMALEAATVGCAVVVGDGRGFAGLLTGGNLDAWRRLNFGAGLLSRPMTAEALRAAIAGYDPADAARIAARLRAEATAEDYAARHVALYRSATAEAPGLAEEAARASAAWLEDLLPSAAERPWRDIVREIAGPLPQPMQEMAGEIRRDMSATLAEALPAAIDAATARVLQGPMQHCLVAAVDAAVATRMEAAVAATSDQVLRGMPGVRAERALRGLWRRILPERVRRPLHRWRRALLRRIGAG
ncbi:glycosyltransferase [Roseomonas sp. HF4]|uniref:glycosyltransferase n=1 Tax=Roseomonas sp. HF4 TaxID=2562313 RepID=UPI0010BFE75B|nr:glycosyltransferase family 4 protein [Roseomonas sp. HF4]